METEQAKASKFVLNYGVILGILSVLLGVVMYITNDYLSPSWIYSLLGFLIFIAVIVYGLKAYKSENGGFLSLAEALKVGIGIALIAGIITAIWSFILMNFIEPDYMAQMTDMQREQALARYPEMTEQQLDQAMEMSSMFLSPWISIAFQIAGSLFMGFIISLVAGLIMKQKRPYDV